jgi:NAD(P)-dependent dehydrogenase (short-subunit alcohol dehydrogenase family)
MRPGVARHREMHAMSDLAGKVAVVTGAGRGIGRATALAFAHHGATVVAANRRRTDGESLVAEIAAAGGKAHFIATDVAEPAQIKRLMDDAVSSCGRIDIVFNNAGCQEPRTPLADTPEDVFDGVFHTNVQSVWLGMKYALAHMVRQGSGAVVNSASVSGLRNPNPGLSLYSASKAAVISLTRSAAMEYAEKGVRINAVAPGRVVTDMMLGSGIMDMSAVAAGLPLRRMGRPEEVAEAAVWLASDAASFVVGHVLCTDGDFMAL